jgi:hypothetical protein
MKRFPSSKGVVGYSNDDYSHQSTDYPTSDEVVVKKPSSDEAFMQSLRSDKAAVRTKAGWNDDFTSTAPVELMPRRRVAVNESSQKKPAADWHSSSVAELNTPQVVIKYCTYIHTYILLYLHILHKYYTVEYEWQ